MKRFRLPWVPLPTAWIEEGGLRRFRWGKWGSVNTAALMLLIVIAQHADRDTGGTKLTYDQMCVAANLSRATVAAALKVLIEQSLIRREPELGQSGYALENFDPSSRGWGKLPTRGLYAGPSVAAFADFTLRSPTELNAMKLYLLFVARRSNETNLAHTTYDAIEKYIGIERARIKPALSRLAAANLVHIEHLLSATNPFGIANAYRLAHLDSYRHMGTIGRRMDDFGEEVPF